MATKLTKKQQGELTEKLAGIVQKNNALQLRLSMDTSVNEMNVNQISGALNRIHGQAIGKELPTVVTIPVNQSGSGDPSPDNIRPITGYTIDGIGIVYGGELNIETGVLTDNFYMVENNIVELIGTSSGIRVWQYPPLQVQSINTDAAGNPKCYSNMYVGRRIVSPGYFYVTASGRRVATIPPAEQQNITEVSAAAEWCQAHPTEMLVPRAEPVSYTLTPEQMIQLLDQL